MWQVIAAILASASPQVSASSTIKGVTFGPRQRLVCEWFTNFENSYLSRCRSLDRKIPPPGDEASIECVEAAVCAQLHKQARRAAAWRKPEPVWGFFEIEFDGRFSVDRRQKRYIGDGTRTVIIDQLKRVRKLPDR